MGRIATHNNVVVEVPLKGIQVDVLPSQGVADVALHLVPVDFSDDAEPCCWVDGVDDVPFAINSRVDKADIEPSCESVSREC